MNQNQAVKIKCAVIRDAILRIALEKPEWVETEGWLKEILFITSTILIAEHGRDQREDNPFPEF